MRGTKPLAAVAAALALAVAGAGGCGGSEEDGPAAPQRPDDPEQLWGREFAGVAASGEELREAIAQPSSIRISFSERGRREIGWEARCNSFGGTVRITPTKLEVTEAIGTLVGCPAERQREDEALTALLESGPRWSLREDRLTLSSDGETLELERP